MTTLAPPTIAIAPAAPARLTGQEALAPGDIGPYELVEGKVVVMRPANHRHGRYEGRLAKHLSIFVDQHKLGEGQTGEVGIYVRRDPDTVRAADVLFISHERLARAAPGDFLDVPPELAVEIVSPDDRWREIQRKIRDYVNVGVNVVLIVDPDEKTVTAYRSLTQAEFFTATDTLTLPDILPGFQLSIADVF